MKDKMSLIKGGHSVEVSGSYVNNIIWEVVCDNVFEEIKDNYEIVLQGFDYIYFLNC